MLGETGTGKEVFAQSIHNASKRTHHPFVALNCSSFSKGLLESEIFGYKAGAFTSAFKDKKGLIEKAYKGTLFLDEIGEMPLELQSKLLRILETNEFIKLGDTKPTRVDVSFISLLIRILELTCFMTIHIVTRYCVAIFVACSMIPAFVKDKFNFSSTILL